MPDEFELALTQGGPIAASIAFVLLAVKAWKSETFTGMLEHFEATKRLAWENLKPPQKTGVSVIMTIVTAFGHVLLGANPWTAVVGALATFAGAQATYTTAKQLTKPAEPKVYEPSPSRPASLVTKL